MDAIKTTKRCKMCRKAILVADYGVNTRGCVRRICPGCIKEREASEDFLPWDWAKAITKATAMHAKHDKLHKTIYTDILTPESLRIVMEAQEYRCMLTKRRFCLPDDGVLKKNETIAKWRKGLSANQAILTPVLTRVDTTNNWAPGNVFFISHFWSGVYDAYGSYPEFLDALKTISKNASCKVLDSITIAQRLLARQQGRLNTIRSQQQ